MYYTYSRLSGLIRIAKYFESMNGSIRFPTKALPLECSTSNRLPEIIIAVKFPCPLRHFYFSEFSVKVNVVSRLTQLTNFF